MTSLFLILFQYKFLRGSTDCCHQHIKYITKCLSETRDHKFKELSNEKHVEQSKVGMVWPEPQRTMSKQALQEGEIKGHFQNRRNRNHVWHKKIRKDLPLAFRCFWEAFRENSEVQILKRHWYVSKQCTESMRCFPVRCMACWQAMETTAVQFLLSSKLLWLQQLVLGRDLDCEPQPLHLYGQL